MDKIVTLNVGGTLFCTATSTLSKFPDSLLGRMFSDDLGMSPSIRDQNGNHFIDRDSTLFAEILNMYRNGKIPEHVEGPLRREIKYWFPGHLVRSESYQKAKKIARGLYQDWKEQKMTSDCLWQEYLISPYVPPDFEFNSAVDIWQKISGFWLLNLLTPEQFDTLNQKYKSGEERWYDSHHLYHEAVEVLDKDPKFFARAKKTLKYLQGRFEQMKNVEFKEEICRMIQRKIGDQFKIIWYTREHVCKKHEDSLWDVKKLSPYVRIEGFQFKYSPNTFIDIRDVLGHTPHRMIYYRNLIPCNDALIPCDNGCAREEKWKRCENNKNDFFCIYRVLSHSEPSDNLENICSAINETKDSMCEALQIMDRRVDLSGVEYELSRLQQVVAEVEESDDGWSPKRRRRYY